MKPAAAPREDTWHRRAAKWTAWLCWLYLLCILALWGLLTWQGDEWWPVTLVMFGPRWIWGLPLAVLVPAVLLLRRRLWWVVTLGLVTWIVPVMGLCVPYTALFAGQPAGTMVRVLTVNVDRNDLNARALARFIAETAPDVVAVQDWTSKHESEICRGPEWHTRRDEQFFLASRYVIREAELATRPAVCEERFCRYVLDMPDSKLQFFNLRLNTPRDGLMDALRGSGDGRGRELEKNSKERREQSKMGSRWVQEYAGPLLIVGDFNTPPDSTIFGEYWSGFTDAYAQASLGWGYTYYNNRTALRLDHILAGPGWRCRRCWIGPDVGSEHRPLVADMEWTGE